MRAILDPVAVLIRHGNTVAVAVLEAVPIEIALDSFHLGTLLRFGPVSLTALLCRRNDRGGNKRADHQCRDNCSGSHAAPPSCVCNWRTFAAQQR